MKPSIPMFIVFALLSVSPAFTQGIAPAGAVRGRVHNRDGLVVTDRGTPLRGCRVSTDMAETLPDRSVIASIKKLGLNAIHLYAESFVRHTPGRLHELVDKLVQWTGDESLYLVVTIGCIDQNGHYDADFTAGFWEYYAHRYAKKTHVLYEIHNEPFAWSPPYPDSVLAMERNAYAIIRRAAPDTHVLFFSYAVPTTAAGIRRDITGLGRSVDWSNCSVALHGYGVTDEALETVVKEVQGAGYCVVNTEPRNLSGEIVNFRQARVHERNGVSYLHFLTAAEVGEPARFTLPIERARVFWKPDFGDWPAASSAPAPRDAFAPMEAELFDAQGGDSGVVDYGDRIGSISHGDYTVYDDFDFKTGAQAFEARVSSGGAGGAIEVRRDAPDGELIGLLFVKPTGGWNEWKLLSCPVRKMKGVRRLCLRFTGGQSDLFDVDWFVFK